MTLGEDSEDTLTLQIGGHAILIDKSMAPKIAEYRWRVVKNVKANKPDGNMYVRGSLKIDGKWKDFFMHRIILDAKQGNFVDHKNGNGLDNRLSNLRLCGTLENQRNRKKRSCAISSEFKGVSKKIYKDGSIVFQASLGIDGKAQYLGQSPDENMAALLYDKSAYVRDNEFNRTNYPLPIVKYILRLEAVAKAAEELCRIWDLHRHKFNEPLPIDPKYRPAHSLSLFETLYLLEKHDSR